MLAPPGPFADIVDKSAIGLALQAKTQAAMRAGKSRNSRSLYLVPWARRVVDLPRVPRLVGGWNRSMRPEKSPGDVELLGDSFHGLQEGDVLGDVVPMRLQLADAHALRNQQALRVCNPIGYQPLWNSGQERGSPQYGAQIRSKRLPGSLVPIARSVTTGLWFRSQQTLCHAVVDGAGLGWNTGRMAALLCYGCKPEQAHRPERRTNSFQQHR